MTLGFVFGVLDMRGPGFLGLYATLAVIAAALTLMIILVLPLLFERGDGRRAAELADAMSPFEAAYLVGGLQRLMETAVASLHRRECVKANALGGLEILLAPKDVVDEVERDVYAAVRARGTRSDLRDAAAFRGLVFRNAQRRDGLLLTRAQHWAVKACAVLPLVVVLALGVAKVFVGVSRDKPVEFLVILCVLTAVVIVLVTGWVVKGVRRTGLGNAVVSRLQADRDKRTRHASDEPDANAEVAAWSCAVFGAAAVYSAAPGIERFFHPPSSSGSGGGSGCTTDTGCGSSCGGCGD